MMLNLQTNDNLSQRGGTQSISSIITPKSLKGQHFQHKNFSNIKQEQPNLRQINLQDSDKVTNKKKSQEMVDEHIE